jgi:hypothetical protein
MTSQIDDQATPVEDTGVAKRPSKRTIMIVVVAAVVLLLAGAGITFALWSLPTLAGSEPDLHTRIVDADEALAGAVADAQTEVERVTVPPEPVDGETLAAWETVVLTSDDPTVVAVTDLVENVTVLRSWVGPMTDADLNTGWVAGLKRVEPTVPDMVFTQGPPDTRLTVTVEQAKDLVGELAAKTTEITEATTVLGVALSTAQKAKALEAYASALDGLNAGLDAANGVLVGSSERVMDNVTRDNLSAAITAATGVRDANTGVTLEDDKDAAGVQAATDALLAALGTLGGPQQAVTDSQVAWQADQDRIAAEAAAAAAAANRPSSSGSSGGSSRSGGSSSSGSSSGSSGGSSGGSSSGGGSGAGDLGSMCAVIGNCGSTGDGSQYAQGA